MSELVYVDYLKELNNTLLKHSYNLSLDFEIGSSHVMDQLNVLDQYLTLNNFLMQDEKGQGINDLLGFVELSEDLWRNRYIEGRKKELKEIQKRNQLFAKGLKHKVSIVKFNKESIKDLEDDLPDLDIDLFGEDIEESNEITEGNDLFESEDFTEELSSEEDINEDLEEDINEDIDEDTETPLLTDIFNDLQKAQNLFDEEDDIEDYQDEYAIIDEDEEEQEEDYPESQYERAKRAFETSSKISNELEMQNFDFPEQPFDISEQPFDNSEQSFDTNNNFNFEQPQTEQRERVFTDAMVDKANDAINKGINALLKKIAK